MFHCLDAARNHFFNGTIGDGPYHLEYIEAVITEDQEEIERIETEVQISGYGPRTSRHTVMNSSSQRPACRKFSFYNAHFTLTRSHRSQHFPIETRMAC